MQQESKRGIILAVCAYIFWGIAPAYFKALQGILPIEILCHRILWSFFLLAATLTATKGWPQVRKVFKSRKSLAQLTLTALLVGSNWLIFIWAVTNNRLIDASLGYFINPIINVLLATLFLGERLKRKQIAAMLLCAFGVSIQLVSFGSIPWIALALALTFGLYGLMRKQIGVDSQTGLFVETLVLLIPATTILFYAPPGLAQPFAEHQVSAQILLLSAGAITTIPLLCFNGAALRISFSLLGILQYIGPSLMFILAVAVYGEELNMTKALTFIFIWLALLLFSIDALFKRHTGKALSHTA